MLIGGASSVGTAASPSRWISRGVGGGGALYSPAINPHNPNEIWVQSDMSCVFRSMDFGKSWTMQDFRKLQGGNEIPSFQFTGDPAVFYAVNYASGRAPSKSTNAGLSWAEALYDPWSREAYDIFADHQANNRLITSDYSDVYCSTNGGISYSNVFSASDCLVAGVLFDGSNIYMGTRAGLVVSTNSGRTFQLSAIAGLPAGEEMVSMAGAREGNLRRLICVTFPSGNVWPGIQGGEHWSYTNVYRLTLTNNCTWIRSVSGIAGGDHPMYAAMSPTNINIAYLGGGSEIGCPIVYKTTNGGVAWQSVFLASNNQNVNSGWSGDQGDRNWDYGEYAMGFTVCASDPNRVAFTDLGFIHATTNGGSTWQQLYLYSGDQNSTNAPTPKRRSYHGIGLEDTSCWWLHWMNTQYLWAGFTDIRGCRSTNCGVTWSFDYSGHTWNSSYECIQNRSNETLYLSGSSVHDMYAWDAYCRDSRIDSGTGAIMFSTNRGATWATMHDFGHPVVGLATDPRNGNRLYATVVDSAAGGVFVSSNVQNGAASTWVKVTNPPRTQGHPYVIRVLNDGTLVCSYSARLTGSPEDFTASSGVFVSTNGGTAWLDRSAANMQYYTKDVVISPHDPAQNTWYAGVWGEWGSSADFGGLYRTTNRGSAWTLITTGLQAVGSCTFNSSNSNELFVCTEAQGLWFTTNAGAATPKFDEVRAYPFRFPTRVFWNPYDTNEVWVTSYGGGMYMGRMVEPPPQIMRIQPNSGTNADIDVAGAAGQRIIMRASTDMRSWQILGTNVVLDQSFIHRDSLTNTYRFYGAGIDP